MRVAAVLILAALPIGSGAACAYEPTDSAGATSDIEDDQAVPAIEPVVTTLSARESLSSLTIGPSAPQQWSFAVLSDLHLPNPRAATVDRTVEGLIALR